MAETLEQRRARLYKVVDDLLPYLEKDFPAMGNRTPGSIVDDIGPMKELNKELERIIKTLQGIADSKLMPGESEIKGDNFKMKLVAMTQRKLHQANAKAVLERLKVDPDEYMYDLDMTQHRFTKL